MDRDHDIVVQVSEVAGSNDAKEWSLLAAGDFALNAAGRSVAAPGKLPFTEKVCHAITHATVSVVNVEGPVDGGTDSMAKGTPVHQLDPKTIQYAIDSGFGVACLANNHILDQAEEGAIATAKACREAGLAVCGLRHCGHENDEVYRQQLDANTSLTIIAFAESEYGTSSANLPHARPMEYCEALAKVAQAKLQGDVVVVLAHGGRTSIPIPPAQRQLQLRCLIDAGASAVIGHHPHVPQGWEKYQNGIIFYSLGNLLFEKASGKRLPKTEWGYIVNCVFRGQALQHVELRLTEIENGMVTFSQAGEVKDKRIAYLHHLAEITSDPKRLLAYWQDMSTRIFKNSYWKVATEPLAVGLAAWLRTRKFSKKLPGQAKLEWYALRRLAYRVTPSHSWGHETALETLTETCRDYRKAEYQKDLSELMKWTK